MTDSDTNAATIPAEVFSKIEQKDIANLIKKARDGKPLTGPQMQRLRLYAQPVEQALTGPTHVTNIAALCAALGISRPTFYKYRKRRAAPKKATNGKHDVGAWREFLTREGVLDTGSATQGDSGETDLSEQKRQHEVEQLRLRCALLRLDYDRKKGTQVPIEEVTEFIRARGSHTRKTLLAMPNALAPQLANRSAQFIAKRLKSWAKTFLRDVREFEPKKGDK